MWKVLLVISSVVLAGAIYLANENRLEKGVVVADVASQTDTLVARTEALDKTNAQITELEGQIQMLMDQTETLETEKVNLDAQVVESKSNLTAKEAQLVTDKEKLASAKETIGDLQEITALQAQMQQIRLQIEESESELAQLEGAVVAAKVEQERMEGVASELEALRKDQEAGIIRGEFQTGVKSAYNKWGFVVIDGGYDQGVVPRAQLDVYRRGQPICKLLVTSVLPNESSADIIPGSLVAGQMVQVGDTVVATQRASAPAAAPAGGAAPTDGVPVDAPAQPGADDPFGGGAAMDAGAAPDPFGGGAAMDAGAAPDPFGGAAPAAPADAAPDPFGGGGAMEQPADPGAAPDPFQ